MIKLKINGKDQSFDGDPNMPLLWYLRDVQNLTGDDYLKRLSTGGASYKYADQSTTVQ